MARCLRSSIAFDTLSSIVDTARMLQDSFALADALLELSSTWAAPPKL